MDGNTLKYQMRQLLAESSTSSYLDDKTTYDFLWQAAIEFVRATGCLTNNQTITTVANQTAYDLNPDFLRLYMRDDRNELFVKYYDSSSYSFISYRDYDAVINANNTNATSTPSSFTIRDKRTAETRLSGNCTANNTSTYGEATLEDNSSNQFANCTVGDMIHNYTDNATGYIVVTGNNSTVTTAMFGGTDNSWGTNDTYFILPQTRKQLLVDPPSLTANHTITVEYVQRPDPVYSSYRAYRIPTIYTGAVVRYAAWLYKYRDMQPDFGDQWYKFWEMEVRKAAHTERSITNKYSWKVNFVKRSFGDRSYR